MTHSTARTGAWPLVFSLTLTLALLGSALGGTFTATPASAADDPTDGGLWYYTAPDLATVHQHTTGKGITVAVLDDPINPAAPDLVGVKNLITRPDSFCEDESGATAPATGTFEMAKHGTNMVSLIVGTGAGTGGQPGTLGVAPGATVRHYAVNIKNGTACKKNGKYGAATALDQAVADGAKIISISQSGTPIDEENHAIARAERAGVIVVAASNNLGGDDLGWPASANGVVSVESDDVNGKLNPEAVTSPQLSVVAPGEAINQVSWSEGRWDTYAPSQGSSDATAWTSGVLALVWSKYPRASANQIIQTLLRNTATGKGKLVRDDSWGYGPVTVNGTLAADPTTYPDVNPLLSKDSFAEPAYADIVGPAKPGPTSTSAATEPGADTGLPGWLLPVGAGLLVLVVLAAIVLAVVLTRRNRTRTAPTPQHRPVQ